MIGRNQQVQRGGEVFIMRRYYQILYSGVRSVTEHSGVERRTKRRLYSSYATARWCRTERSLGTLYTDLRATEIDCWRLAGSW